MTEAPRIDALVLAGGRSSRMQATPEACNAIDKAHVMLGDEPLIAHVVRTMRSAIHTLYISTNGNPDVYRAIGVPVADARDPASEAIAFDGPLAGVLAGLCATQAEWLAVAPCDTPFLPKQWIQRLYAVASAQGARLAVASQGGVRQPVCMLVHVSLRDGLQTALANGERKVGMWQRQCAALEVSFDDAPVESFMNINTPDELTHAHAVLALRQPAR